jgi:hypothetical protein
MTMFALNAMQSTLLSHARLCFPGTQLLQRLRYRYSWRMTISGVRILLVEFCQLESQNLAYVTGERDRGNTNAYLRGFLVSFASHRATFRDIFTPHQSPYTMCWSQGDRLPLLYLDRGICAPRDAGPIL